MVFSISDGTFAPLFDALDVVAGVPAHTPTPPSFEELGLRHGLMIYDVDVPGPRSPHDLSVVGLSDPAHLYLDGRHQATLEHDPVRAVVRIRSDDVHTPT